MSHAPRIRTVLSCTLLVASLAASATACAGSGANPLSAKPYDAAGQVSFNGPAGNGKTSPDKPLEITARGTDGRITDVTATDASGRYLAGELSADGSRWHSTAPLAADAHYTVKVGTEDQDGAPGLRTLTFDTAAASNRLKVTFGPEGGTYGVGQPITAQLSAKIKSPAARAVVERSLRVETSPSVDGAWYWVDDNLLHYRPKEYWPAHTTINVHSNLDGIKVEGKLYGGAATPLKITTGDRMEAVTDSGSHYMTVKRNGNVINTIPVTTGKPGYSTRNGVKVVLGKEYYVQMRGTSIGIPEGSSDSYNLPVYYATRVTWSGEYVHAAPWSVGSQGYDNVSHGCTGMSTDNAAWFFNNFRSGDLVTVVNSEGDTMTPFDNGFGDWNLSWAKWRKGSALDAGTQRNSDPAAPADSEESAGSARLRPTAA
ncbi:L,D-transpeptidase [Streptomyces beijiangensis]|uniref:L,D-transpeptidase family protein n=1 Tax=Streptomyces beijiangensis TaxID=163361 RepID=A0A939FAX2_9ACTN|nr:Ig-like domain-containing protein [Streptomyces beijiangensis]MBO0513690.1 L,D-transpeptidase family protein [Streptomyces beijiangensis]